jgi:CzcA family heavy metal efflux pump
MKNLIQMSLSFKGLVLIVATGILVFGAYTTTTMPVDVFPDFTAPTVTILTEAHGMAPEEVETLVTFPIETAMNGAKGVRRVRSSSAYGFSIVWVEFDWGTDISTDRQIVTEKLTLVRDSMPEQVDSPTMAPQGSVMGEIFFLAIQSEELSPFELRTFSDTTLRRRLLAVEGVAQVVPVGGEVKQYQVVLSQSKLRAYGISSSDVTEALRETNENSTAGILVDGGQDFLIQGMGRVQNLEDIGETVITVRNGTPVLVSQVGVVQIGPQLKRGEGSAMAQPAVLIGITKQSGTNTLEVDGRIMEALDEIEASMPPGMTMQRSILRQADFIDRAVHNVVFALRDGGILVIIIIFLFLGNFRASLITLTAIPLSLLTAVLVLKVWGASINTMTLGGMAIASGSLVDDAIVDVENVFRRLRENAKLPKSERRSALSVVYDASVEIRSSILFATIIVMLAFLPLFFLSGVEGLLLRPLAVAYVVAQVVSAFVAVTVTPALCLILLPKSRAVHSEKEPLVMRLSTWMYRPILDRVLNHHYIISLFAVSLLVLALASIPFMGQSFLPDFNEGALTLLVNTLPGTSLEESDNIGRKVEEILLSQPEVVACGRKTGRGELSEHALGVESSEIEVSLDMERGTPQRSKEELLAELRHDFSSLSGVNVEIGQPISHRIDHILSGTRAAIAVKIFAPEDDPQSLRRLRELGGMVEEELAEIEGIVDLTVEQLVDVPVMRIHFDREAMQRHGFHITDITHEVERAFAGEAVSEVLEGRNAFELVVRTTQPGTATEQDIHELPLRTEEGAIVPLGAVARIERGGGPNMISRESVHRKLVVSCSVAGRDVGSVVSEIQARIEENVPFGEDAYEGYYVNYGGQFESARSASRILIVLTLIVAVCIGLLLEVAFRSARDAAFVMMSLPLAMIGGILGVFVSGGVLSVASLVGFITLLGITTRNGIVLISHIRHLQREEGVDNFREAVRQGSIERLTPVLMTALTTGLALIPLAISGSEPGNEIQTPLAIVVIFGLFSSTFLNMIVVPSLFLRWGDRCFPDDEQATEENEGESPHSAV